jgi:D-sedoheptulose 7-phosphate isomerase
MLREDRLRLPSELGAAGGNVGSTKFGERDVKHGGASMNAVHEYLVHSRDTIEAALDDPSFTIAIAVIVEAIANALGHGRKLLLAGNPGSAADAQHLAGEIVSRMSYDRAPAAALAMTIDSSVVTAIGNDYGYDRLFEHQIIGLGCPRDVFVAISTSSCSPNIRRAIDAARQRRMVIVGLTGSTGEEMTLRCDLCLRAPSDSTPLIQQIHVTAGHIICGLVEERLFPRA